MPNGGNKQSHLQGFYFKSTHNKTIKFFEKWIPQIRYTKE